jgi:hypothetical protein
LRGGEDEASLLECLALADAEFHGRTPRIDLEATRPSKACGRFIKLDVEAHPVQQDPSKAAVPSRRRGKSTLCGIQPRRPRLLALAARGSLSGVHTM